MTTLSVWQFRIRYHLKKHGDSKKVRTRLRTLFGDGFAPLVDALVEERDAEVEYEGLARMQKERVDAVNALDRFLDESSRCCSAFEDQTVSDLPVELRRATAAMLKRWSEASSVLRRAMKPYETKTEGIQRKVRAAHTRWQRAVSAAKATHAKYEPEEAS